MKNNQFTLHDNEPAGKNLNIRLPATLRERVDTQTKRHHITKADVIRVALEHYLPLLEGQPTPEIVNG